MKPLLPAPYTPEDEAILFRHGRGRWATTLRASGLQADIRDAALMLWLTVRCDHERWLREEFGPGGLPGPAAVVLEHAPHLWRHHHFNITCCA